MISEFFFPSENFTLMVDCLLFLSLYFSDVFKSAHTLLALFLQDLDKTIADTTFCLLWLIFALEIDTFRFHKLLFTRNQCEKK